MSKQTFRKEVLALDQLPEILPDRTLFPPSQAALRQVAPLGFLAPQGRGVLSG